MEEKTNTENALKTDCGRILSLFRLMHNEDCISKPCFRLFGETYNCNLLGKIDSVYMRIHPNQKDGSSCGLLVLIVRR